MTHNLPTFTLSAFLTVILICTACAEESAQAGGVDDPNWEKVGPAKWYLAQFKDGITYKLAESYKTGYGLISKREFWAYENSNGFRFKEVNWHRETKYRNQYHFDFSSSESLYSSTEKCSWGLGDDDQQVRKSQETFNASTNKGLSAGSLVLSDGFSYERYWSEKSSYLPDGTVISDSQWTQSYEGEDSTGSSLKSEFPDGSFDYSYVGNGSVGGTSCEITTNDWQATKNSHAKELLKALSLNDFGQLISSQTKECRNDRGQRRSKRIKLWLGSGKLIRFDFSFRPKGDRGEEPTSWDISLYETSHESLRLLFRVDGEGVRKASTPPKLSYSRYFYDEFGFDERSEYFRSKNLEWMKNKEYRNSEPDVITYYSYRSREL